MSNPRKPPPYTSLGSYNKFEEEKTRLSEQQIPVTSQQSYHQQPQQQPQQPQPQPQQPHPQQSYPQHPQHPQQPSVQQQSPVQPTRFKHIQTSEHLHNVLTTGVTQFQNNFISKNVQPPPMRILVKLYTDWCGPCKKLGPIMDEISLHPDTKDIIFTKFDAELMIKGQCHFSSQLRDLFQISAVPAMFGFIDGKLVGKVFGADMKEITELINKLRQ
jgi:thioredoxin 1